MTRPLWDRPATRSAVRNNFDRMLRCQTTALGADVFASESDQLVRPYTCKSRFCPRCGYRRTYDWQREQVAILPDIPYVAVSLTMPRELWPIFRENRRLLHDLSALGAAVMQRWAQIKCGAEIYILVAQHTFGRDLKFNPHLHLLVSAGGFQTAAGRWVRQIPLFKRSIMRMWQYLVITYLRAALKAGKLRSNLSCAAMIDLLREQYERDYWIIDIKRSISKARFLIYISRYVRRPPLAQHHILSVTDQAITFRYHDLEKKCQVMQTLSPAEFVVKLAEHVPDRYKRTIRYFGLLSPRTKAQKSAAVLAILGLQRQHRHRKLRWREAIWVTFRRDPLRDSRGQTMRWIARRKPAAA